MGLSIQTLLQCGQRCREVLYNSECSEHVSNTWASHTHAHVLQVKEIFTPLLQLSMG